MKIRINKDMGIYKVGTQITVPDTDGIPADIYWRRRLADAEIDNCCSVIIKTKSKPKPGAKADTRKKTTKGED